VPPTSHAGGKVRLYAELWKGGTWVRVKTGFATISFTGTCSWRYKPAKKGAYRVQAAIIKTDEPWPS